MFTQILKEDAKQPCRNHSLSIQTWTSTTILLFWNERGRSLTMSLSPAANSDQQSGFPNSVKGRHLVVRLTYLMVTHCAMLLMSIVLFTRLCVDTTDLPILGQLDGISNK